MSYEHVIWEQDGGVGRLTLNRPDSLNAWTRDFGRELKQAIEDDAADPSVRAVLITGSGRGFSSGADLKAGFDPAPDDGMPDVRKELHELYHPIIAGVRRLEKPVVAAVNGPAVGIGASLAFACDLILAAESAFFGLAFVNIGLMPDGGSTLFVPTAVGKARAFEMALLGELVPAERALEWGLVNRVAPAAELDAVVDRLVEAISRSSPLTVGIGKEAFYQQVELDEHRAYDLTKSVMAMNSMAADAQEGICAFLEKRPPEWTSGYTRRAGPRRGPRRPRRRTRAAPGRAAPPPLSPRPTGGSSPAGPRSATPPHRATRRA